MSWHFLPLESGNLCLGICDLDNKICDNRKLKFLDKSGK